MTSTRCERSGQIEIGIIEHEGHEFAALGASVIGRNITGYTKQDHYGTRLQTWCGKTMLDARCTIVKRYWSGSLALMYRLPRGRFIVGYSLGDGMLFRGELISNYTEGEARRQASILAEFFAYQDNEDEESFQAKLAEE